MISKIRYTYKQSNCKKNKKQTNKQKKPLHLSIKVTQVKENTLCSLGLAKSKATIITFTDKDPENVTLRSPPGWGRVRCRALLCGNLMIGIKSSTWQMNKFLQGPAHRTSVQEFPLTTFMLDARGPQIKLQ